MGSEAPLLGAGEKSLEALTVLVFKHVQTTHLSHVFSVD